VLIRWAALAVTADFWASVGASLLRVVLAFGIGTVTGALLAAATHLSPWAGALLGPVLRVIRATPISSFIILALVWLPGGSVPVLCGALMVLPVVWGSVSQGLRDTDKGLLEMAAVYRFSAWRRALRVYAPSTAPAFFAACQTALGLCWKAGVAAEVIGRPGHSVGTRLYEAKIYLQTESLFAWTLTVILLSVALEHALAACLRAFAPRVKGV
jgi:NitT/TauT family transport system permease protein